MGYFELLKVPCQLCGVSFDIDRVRTAKEPRDAGWGDGGRQKRGVWTPAKGSSEYDCPAGSDCCLVYRGNWDHQERDLYPDDLDDQSWIPQRKQHDEDDDEDETLEYNSDAHIEDLGDVDMHAEDSEIGDDEHLAGWTFRVSGPTHDTEYWPLSTTWDLEKQGERDGLCPRPHYRYEHIAGPNCTTTEGYHGDRISLEEMRGCNTVQCLVEKDEHWKPDNDDIDFEIDASYHLSGVTYLRGSSGGPLFFAPVRHAVEGKDSVTPEFCIPDCASPSFLKDNATPFHPTCFEIFLQASRLLLGHIDVDSLVRLRDTACYAGKRFPVTRNDDVKAAEQQAWVSQVGCEYLAANPIFVPALTPILISAISDDRIFSINSSAFEPRQRTGVTSRADDPFIRLPREITLEIVGYLSSPDIAALRLSSRAFTQLPISLWYCLVLSEMPWLYEAWSSYPEPYYWATVIGSDLKEKQDAYTEYRDKIEHEREVIRQEMPEVIEQWVENEPVFEYQESQGRREMLKSSPVSLPRGRTNWYRLYRNITANWNRLKGLQNRARIWNDVTQIIERIKEIHNVDNPDVSAWQDMGWHYPT